MGIFPLMAQHLPVLPLNRPVFRDAIDRPCPDQENRQIEGDQHRRGDGEAAAGPDCECDIGDRGCGKQKPGLPPAEIDILDDKIAFLRQAHLSGHFQKMGGGGDHCQSGQDNRQKWNNHRGPSRRFRIPFISSISACWDLTIPAHNLRICGSVIGALLHIRIAPA